MDEESEHKNIQINEKFKEICRRLSEQGEEHIGKNKKREKKYENYVIYAIWNRLKNYDLKPIREKGVGNKYRIDLYFPQIKMGIECDEPHHANREEEDKKRKKEIKEKLPGYEEIRIKIYSKETEKEISFEEIENEIDNAVKKIKERIKNTKIDKWNPPPKATLQYFKNKEKISVDDYIIFENQRDVLKIIFDCENKGSGPKKAFFTPKTLKKGEYKECKVWFPKLGSNDYGNEWDEENGIFSEKNVTPDRKNRIIFAGLNGGEKYKFLGIFEYDEVKGERAYFKRISKEIPIIRSP